MSAEPGGREEEWTTFVNSGLKAFGIVGNWNEHANNAVRWRKTVKGWAETLMTEWHEKKKVIAGAGYAKEAAEEGKLAACSALASGVTAVQAMVLRKAISGPSRALPPPPKRQ